MAKRISRRRFLRDSSLLTTGTLLAGGAGHTRCGPVAGPARISGEITIDPAPFCELSPHFYLQFMEPLGSTDGSVDSAWDYLKDDWRDDVVEIVKDLAPDALRWGGAFVRYYKWREGVGPAAVRPRMFNYVWGGTETNRVGTHELNDLCRRVGAEPLIAINFLSDGAKAYRKTSRGEDRVGDVREAADWVSYANDPDSSERRRHGHPEPYGIKLWQLGNETSYMYEAGFSLDEAVSHAVAFSRAMKERDPSITIIGWGDVPDPEKLRPETPGDDPDIQFWARDMLERAGEHLDMISMHMMGIYPRDDSRISGFEYQKYPEETWESLKSLANIADFRLNAMKAVLREVGSDAGIAVTEGHLSLQPYNANQVLTTWLSAVYHARTLNAYLRHADRVKLCTGADFCGTRWTVNAVMMPVPRGRSFLLPVGSIARLYKRHKGTHGVRVTAAPVDLDVAATRTEGSVFLHVLNTSYSSPVEATFHIQGSEIDGGRVHAIAPEDPLAYINQNRIEVFDPVETPLSVGNGAGWTFPARSVSVVELKLAGEGVSP